MAKVKAELDAEKLPESGGLQSLLADDGGKNTVNRVPLPGSKLQLLDSEGLSLDERLTVDEARELQRNLVRLMEEGDLDAVTLSDGKNVIRNEHVQWMSLEIWLPFEYSVYGPILLCLYSQLLFLVEQFNVLNPRPGSRRTWS